MFCIVETVEDNVICCQAVPKSWLQNDELRWPPEKVLRKNGIRKQVPPEDSWQRMPFRMLKDNICNIYQFVLTLITYLMDAYLFTIKGDLLTARKFEEKYEKYTNTDEANAHEDEKMLRRKHPVNLAMLSEAFDFNDLFIESETEIEKNLNNNGKYHIVII